MDELLCSEGGLKVMMKTMQGDAGKKKIVVILDTEPKWGGEHQYALTLMDCVKKTDGDVEFAAICGNRLWRQWCRDVFC